MIDYKFIAIKYLNNLQKPDREPDLFANDSTEQVYYRLWVREQIVQIKHRDGLWSPPRDFNLIPTRDKPENIHNLDMAYLEYEATIALEDLINEGE